MATQDQLRAHTERAVAALTRGALDEAAQEFSHAIYLDPRDVMLRQRLADLLVRLDRKPEAVLQFQQVAGHYAAKGELLKAIAISRTILDLDPEHHQTQETLAHLYAKRAQGGGKSVLPPSMSASAVAATRPGYSSQPGVAKDRNAILDPAARVFPTAPSTAKTLDDGPKFSKPPAELAAEEVSEAVVDLSAAQRTPLFSMLDEDVFTALVAKLALRWVKAGEWVVREGEPGDSMFVVVQGEMHVVRHGNDPKRPPQALLGEGSFFGEIALVARSPRLASVIAAKDGLLIEIDRESLDALSLQHPGIERMVHDFFRDRLLSNLLAVSPIFRSFSSEERRKIGARFTLRSLPPGAHILEQNHEGAGLFVLLRGQCQPFHTSDDGAETPYPPLREGDVFGEISLLFGTLCTATVRTLTHVEVLELPALAFKELVLPNKGVREMIDLMARERLNRTTDLMLERDEVMDSWLV